MFAFAGVGIAARHNEIHGLGSNYVCIYRARTYCVPGFFAFQAEVAFLIACLQSFLPSKLTWIPVLLQTTTGGLLLTVTQTKTIQEALIGTVLAVGEDVDVGVKVGSTVLFSKYSSSDVKVPDGEVCFVAQKSILATLS